MWYTLSYTYEDGTKQRLYNLHSTGADVIEAAQTFLGSHSFKREIQSHHYSQLELDIVKAAVRS